MQKYRINSPTLAMFAVDGQHVAQVVPEGTTITTDGKKFNGEKLIEVVWNGKVVMMFTQNVRSRGELI